MSKVFIPTYLAKSRHGVYYVRFVTPRAVRNANPALPKEVRKSLHTRCPREAVVRSQRMALDYRANKNRWEAAMGGDDSSFSVTPNDNGTFTYHFAENDTQELIEKYLQMARAVGLIPAENNILAKVAHSSPTPQEFTEVHSRYQDLKTGGAWLSETVEIYAQEMLNSKKWETNTWERTYKPLLRDFRELVSQAKRDVNNKDGLPESIWDVQVRQLGEDHIQRYCDAMWKYPANYASKKDAGDAKQALNSGYEPQSRSNAHKKIRMVGTFLRWAYKRKKLSDELADLLPVEHVDKKADKSKEGYQPWTEAELKKIFERKTYPADGWEYWIPILGLYTGARANELAQLLVSDVVTMGDIPCIYITDLDDIDDDEPIATPDASKTHRKSVKNAASRRLVPIHPKVVELGFLRFVEAQKDKKEFRLFPELPYDKNNGYARYVSRDFAETTKSLGIWVKRKKVFHSFRSTLNGRLLRLGMSQELRDFMLGHTNESMNVQKYGRQIEDRPIGEMYKWLCQVDFGLDLPKFEMSYPVPDM